MKSHYFVNETTFLMMKNLALLFFFILSASICSAQRAGTVGPKAKQQKVWKSDKSEKSILYSETDVTRTTGISKHEKSWNKKAKRKTPVVYRSSRAAHYTRTKNSRMFH